MQIIIDIPEENYERYKRLGDKSDILFEAICNGTLLPNEQRRKFEEVIIEYPPDDLCTYPEYKGKPYFSIKYEENGEHFIGFGTYKPDVFSRYLQEYFIVPTIVEVNREEE